MSFDGIVTKAIVDDIKAKLINGKISKVNQPDKNELDLIIYKLISNIGLKITLWYKITSRTDLSYESKIKYIFDFILFIL